MKKQKAVFGILLAVAFSLFAVGLTSAYDASTPYTVTMNWIIPSDTTFTVTLAGAESAIEFEDNVVDSNSKYVQPDSQDNDTTTPIVTITNTGNTVLNFTTALNETKPAWAILIMSNTTDPLGGNVVDDSAVLIQGNIPAGNSTTMYLWTNLTNAISGTTPRNIQINSTAAE